VDPTQRVRLGRTDVDVTRLGLGTAPLGGMFAPVSDASAEETVRTAHDLGWRLFDSAPLYGYGMAENRLGLALAGREAVISTKVGRVLRPAEENDETDIFRQTPPLRPVFDFSEEGVSESLASSFERLGVDRVDVVHIHDPDDHYEPALKHALPELVRMREAGTIAAVGAGMNQTRMLCEFAEDGQFDCFLVAGRYSLLDPSAATKLLPMCLERNIAVICGGVFNSGVLASGGTYDYAPAPPDVLERTRRLTGVAARHDVPLKAAAIQFPLGHEAVTCVVVGARTGAEVEENDAMFRFEIPAAFWEDVRREGLIPDDIPVPL
jgi:D-threo-aldose 1-dehydrogenase